MSEQRPDQKPAPGARERGQERRSTADMAQGLTEGQYARYRRRFAGDRRTEQELRNAGVPTRYRRPWQFKEALIPEGAKRLLHTWREGGCLVLAGPPGTGKTVTACWLAMQLWRRGELVGDSARGYLWAAPVLHFAKVRHLYSAVFARRTVPMDRARQADVLILDDWGAAYEHDWPLSELDGLVDDRWDLHRSTIVTTNLPATREQGGVLSLEASAERAYSRLLAAPGPGLVVLDRKDLRR